MIRRKATALALCFAAGLPGSVLADSAVDASDARARAVLRQMTDHLAQQKNFTLKAANTIEVVLVSGQKLQFDSASEVAVARPNKMQAARIGDLDQQAFVYDGQKLSVFSQNDGNPFYATVAAPPTLEGALDFARESLDIIAPAGDLLYADAYNILMEDVISGMYVGAGMVGGVHCHHLAFRGTQTDWQIWIEDGARPLPRKMVITSKWTTGAPQYTVTTSDWDMAPKLAADRFKFVPPKDVVRLDFLAPAAAPALSRQSTAEGRK
jgi:hypothetical protein